MKFKKNMTDEEEKRLLEEIENSDDWVPVSAKEKAKHVKAARAHVKSLKKEHQINIRMNGQLLFDLKNHAYNQGIPYQTLITNVLTRYLSRELVDINAVKVIVDQLRGKPA